MNKCPHCGADLQENASFCLHCMTPLKEKKIIPTGKPTRRSVWRALTAVLSAVCLVLVILLWPKNGPITPAIGGEQTTTSTTSATSTTTRPPSSTTTGIAVSSNTGSASTTTTSGSSSSTTTTTTAATEDTTTTTTGVESSYRIGTIADGIYINEWANMKLVIPEQWQVATATADSENHCDLRLLRADSDPKFQVRVTHIPSAETTEEYAHKVYDQYVAECDAIGRRYSNFGQVPIAGKTFRGIIMAANSSDDIEDEYTALFYYAMDGMMIEIYVNVPVAGELSQRLTAFTEI